MNQTNEGGGPRATAHAAWQGFLSFAGLRRPDSDPRFEGLDPADQYRLAAFLEAENRRFLRFFALVALVNLLAVIWVWGRVEAGAEERVAELLPELVEARSAELSEQLELEYDRLAGEVQLARDLLTRLTSEQISALASQGTRVDEAVRRSGAALRRLDLSLDAALDELEVEERRLGEVARDLDDLLFRLVELNGAEGFELAKSLATLAASMQSGSAVDQLNYLRADVQALHREVRDQTDFSLEQAEALERLQATLFGSGAEGEGLVGQLGRVEQDLRERN